MLENGYFDITEKNKKQRNKVMASSSSSGDGGVGFTGLLTILFIGLKLGGVINWSWLWVLSPLWIGWSIILIIFILILFVD